MNTAPRDDLKSQIRRDALAKRDALSGEFRMNAAETVAMREFPIEVPAGAVVSGFFPLKTEINPVRLMRRLVAGGAQLALPLIVGRGKPLSMRAFAFGDELIPGQWGILEPSPAAPEVEPDILIVPLLAFDRVGQRVGYGAGYYDLTITTLRRKKPITAIGIAFAAQEIPQVPATPNDAPLDFVLTEREVIDLRE
ncbi:MAG: 5-formyltetrahydrofolate cyclo-ligase [Xanthobacteraceae bacterium]|jgi:5-formyltetrahydrofolate cyclo-ligase|nr:5-formyltetrahydrofolate cyclo-ligase [Xanthobacteraceae bacterium]